MNDPFDLDRFIRAQASTYLRALAELQAGEKRTHWMWFIFPQARGLGHSAMAMRYGVVSLDEARAYLAHPILGARLSACTQAVLAHGSRPLRAIFGSPDDLKFGSSMTLFALAQSGDGGLFRSALDQCCEGRDDPRTRALFGAES